MHLFHYNRKEHPHVQIITAYEGIFCYSVLLQCLHLLQKRWLRTPPRNDSRTAEVRHLDRGKQTPLPLARQLEKLAWRPA